MRSPKPASNSVMQTIESPFVLSVTKLESNRERPEFNGLSPFDFGLTRYTQGEWCFASAC